MSHSIRSFCLANLNPLPFNGILVQEKKPWLVGLKMFWRRKAHILLLLLSLFLYGGSTCLAALEDPFSEDCIVPKSPYQTDVLMLQLLGHFLSNFTNYSKVKIKDPCAVYLEGFVVFYLSLRQQHTIKSFDSFLCDFDNIYALIFLPLHHLVFIKTFVFSNMEALRAICKPFEDCKFSVDSLDIDHMRAMLKLFALVSRVRPAVTKMLLETAHQAAPSDLHFLERMQLLDYGLAHFPKNPEYFMLKHHPLCLLLPSPSDSLSFWEYYVFMAKYYCQLFQLAMNISFFETPCFATARRRLSKFAGMIHEIDFRIEDSFKLSFPILYVHRLATLTMMKLSSRFHDPSVLGRSVDGQYNVALPEAIRSEAFSKDVYDAFLTVLFPLNVDDRVGDKFVTKFTIIVKLLQSAERWSSLKSQYLLFPELLFKRLFTALNYTEYKPCNQLCQTIRKIRCYYFSHSRNARDSSHAIITKALEKVYTYGVVKYYSRLIDYYAEKLINHVSRSMRVFPDQQLVFLDNVHRSYVESSSLTPLCTFSYDEICHQKEITAVYVNKLAEICGCFQWLNINHASFPDLLPPSKEPSFFINVITACPDGRLNLCPPLKIDGSQDVWKALHQVISDDRIRHRPSISDLNQVFMACNVPSVLVPNMQILDTVHTVDDLERILHSISWDDALNVLNMVLDALKKRLDIFGKTLDAFVACILCSRCPLDGQGLAFSRPVDLIDGLSNLWRFRREISSEIKTFNELLLSFNNLLFSSDFEFYRRFKKFEKAARMPTYDPILVEEYAGDIVLVLDNDNKMVQHHLKQIHPIDMLFALNRSYISFFWFIDHLIHHLKYDHPLAFASTLASPAFKKSIDLYEALLPSMNRLDKILQVQGVAMLLWDNFRSDGLIYWPIHFFKSIMRTRLVEISERLLRFSTLTPNVACFVLKFILSNFGCSNINAGNGEITRQSFAPLSQKAISAVQEQANNWNEVITNLLIFKSRTLSGDQATSMFENIRKYVVNTVASVFGPTYNKRNEVFDSEDIKIYCDNNDRLIANLDFVIECLRKCNSSINFLELILDSYPSRKNCEESVTLEIYKHFDSLVVARDMLGSAWQVHTLKGILLKLDVASLVKLDEYGETPCVKDFFKDLGFEMDSSRVVVYHDLFRYLSLALPLIEIKQAQVNPFFQNCVSAAFTAFMTDNAAPLQVNIFGTLRNLLKSRDNIDRLNIQNFVMSIERAYELNVPSQHQFLLFIDMAYFMSYFFSKLSIFEPIAGPDLSFGECKGIHRPGQMGGKLLEEFIILVRTQTLTHILDVLKKFPKPANQRLVPSWSKAKQHAMSATIESVMDKLINFLSFYNGRDICNKPKLKDGLMLVHWYNRAYGELLNKAVDPNHDLLTFMEIDARCNRSSTSSALSCKAKPLQVLQKKELQCKMLRMYDFASFISSTQLNVPNLEQLSLEQLEIILASSELLFLSII